MKKILLALGFAGIPLTALYADKIGIIDPAIIRGNYTKYTNNAKALNKNAEAADRFFSDKQRSLINLRNELESLSRDIENPMINEEAKGRKKIDLRTNDNVFQKACEDFDNLKREVVEDFREKRRKLHRELFREITEKTALVAKEMKIDVVLSSDDMDFHDRSLDITLEVLKKLNDSYAVNPASPSAPTSADTDVVPPSSSPANK